MAPRLGQPGTYLRVLGSGLCPDSKMFFGAGDSQGAPLESRSADGRSALVRVPFTAVDGQPTLTNPDSDGRSAGAVRSARALTIATYRNTFGFPFVDPKSDGPNWGDIVRLYGKGKTTIEVDPCGAVTFGIADCGISTGIRSPRGRHLLQQRRRLRREGQLLRVGPRELPPVVGPREDRRLPARRQHVALPARRGRRPGG